MTNWEEYIAGTDPNDPGSYLRIEHLKLPDGTLLARVQFWAISNRTYTLQSCPGLDAGLWTRVADLVAAPTNRLLEITDPTPVPKSSHRFYRLATPRLAD
jgi:hypothetical protein